MANIDLVMKLIYALGRNSEGMSLDEMAEYCEVSRRTAERLRDTIRNNIAELEQLEDGRIRRWRIGGKLGTMFTLPTARELSALNAEIKSLEENNQKSRAKLLSHLLKKVTSAMDQRAKNRTMPDFEALNHAQRVFVPAGPAVFIEPEIFTTIQQAIMANQMLEFNYQAAWHDTPQWRRVVPYGLVHGNISYLVAAIPQSEHGTHTYRLDKMTDVKVSEIYGAPPKDFNLAEWMSQSFGIWQGEKEKIVLKILPHASERVKGWRFHLHQTLSECDDGSIMVEFEASGMRELAVHLCGWVGDIKIIAPEKLKEEITQIQNSQFF